MPAIFCRPFENQTLIIPTSTSDFKPMNHIIWMVLSYRKGLPRKYRGHPWTILALKPVVLRFHLLRNPQTTAIDQALGHWWAQPSTKRRKAIRSDWRITFSCCVGEEKGKWYAGMSHRQNHHFEPNHIMVRHGYHKLNVTQKKKCLGSLRCGASQKPLDFCCKINSQHAGF